MTDPSVHDNPLRYYPYERTPCCNGYWLKASCGHKDHPTWLACSVCGQDKED